MGYVLARYGVRAYAEAVSVAANLVRLREAAGISQSELGRRVGVPATRIWDWEHGRYKLPDMKTLMRLATALTVSIDDLISGVNSDYDAVIETRTGVAPVIAGIPSRHVRRAVRLLEQMSEAGQLLAAKNIALLAAEFRLGTPQESIAKPTRTHAATSRKAHGKR